MMMEVTFLLACLVWSNCLTFSLGLTAKTTTTIINFYHYSAQTECTSGSFYENGNDFDRLSTIDTGYWYLNLEFPSSCSGRVDNYEVMNFPSGPGSGQAVTVSLWSPASDQNGMYNIIVSKMFILLADHNSV